MQQQITLDYLTNVARNFINNEYNIDLNIPIKINNRLRRTLGRYLENQSGKPSHIDLSNKLFIYAHQAVAIGVVKHEVLHYALKKLNKPSKDGEPYFERELERLQLPSSTNPNRSIMYVGKKYVFHCSKCHQELVSTIKRVKQKPNSYRSSCCKQRFIYSKTIICDGTHNGICLFLNN